MPASGLAKRVGALRRRRRNGFHRHLVGDAGHAERTMPRLDPHLGQSRPQRTDPSRRAERLSGGAAAADRPWRTRSSSA